MRTATLDHHLDALSGVITAPVLRRLAHDVGQEMARSATGRVDADSLAVIAGAVRKLSVPDPTLTSALRILLGVLSGFGSSRVHWRDKVRKESTCAVSIGVALTAVDPEDATRHLARMHDAGAAGSGVAEIVLGAYRSELRSLTRAVGSRPDVLPASHTEAVVVSAILLLSEPLFDWQIADLARLPLADVQAAIDSGVGTRTFTREPDEVRELISGPITPGAVALTKTGRAKAREYLEKHSFAQP